MSMIEVKVPNIGDFKEVEVIELLVQPGDEIGVDQSLITVESDKASMEIPSAAGGVVKELKVKVGDKVSEGSVLLLLEGGAAGAPDTGQATSSGQAVSSASAAASSAKAANTAAAAETSAPVAPAPAPVSRATQAAPAGGSGKGSVVEVKVPNIGDFKDVEVIEVLANAGDTIAVEQSLVTVESDKASMEIPSATAGLLKEMKVKVGDRISEGQLLALIEAAGSGEGEAAATSVPVQAAPAAASGPVAAPGTVSERPSSVGSAEVPDMPMPAGPHEVPERTTMAAEVSEPGSIAVPGAGPGGEVPEHQAKPHASPSVRKFARELGVDLSKVQGSGEKQRITHEDVQNWVKSTIARSGEAASAGVAASGSEGGAALGLIPWPKVDFAKLGPIESRPVARIRKMAAANLHRNWVMIPHVTNHDEADITELEAFRVRLNREQEKGGTKVTMLAFLIKACVSTLQKYPEFNSSLEGENLILKRYWHIGFAADTPNGLTVPVIRDADTKGILQIAKETSELAAKAREGKLSPTEMQGGTFTISSLGGIGGTYFTPIINAPEVAILGVCRSSTKPVWDGKEFQPRLILPLSLSWDHRVVDGAGAARFNVHLAQLLADFRRVML